MKKLIFILLLTIPFIGFGQGWEKTFGGTSGDGGKSVQQTTDGGYIITGFTYSFGNGDSDIYLIKTDSQGDTLWTNTFGGNDEDEGYSVQQTTDGGYVICGHTLTTDSLGNGDSDIYLIKTDSQGDTLWTNTFGVTQNDFGRSVQQTTDGGYIITGVGFNDVIIVKTNSNGDQIWVKNYGTQIYGDLGESIQQTIDGGYIICGFTVDVINQDRNIYLIKTDPQGDTIWTKTYGSSSGGSGVLPSNDEGYSVQQTTDGGYIICGSTKIGFGNPLWGTSYGYLIKINSYGDTVWTKQLSGVELCSKVQQTTDGGYIMTGSNLSNSSGISKVWLIKTNSQGDISWIQTFNDTNYSNGNSVQQTTDGGYIVVGRTYSNLNQWDVYLIKTDGNGNITSTFNIPTPSSNRKLEKVVDILGRETKPQPNTPFIEIYDDGSTEKKIVVE